MRIRLLTSRATASRVDHAGDVVDIDAIEAVRLIERGHAEPIREAETPVETTTRRRRAEKATA